MEAKPLAELLSKNPGHVFITIHESDLIQGKYALLIYIDPSLTVYTYGSRSVEHRGIDVCAINGTSYLAIAFKHKVLQFVSDNGIFKCRSVHEAQNMYPHDLHYYGDILFVALTGSNLIRNMSNNANIIPKFVKKPIPPTRCALNCFILNGQSVRYVSAFGVTDEPLGYRMCRWDKGFIYDMSTDTNVVEGISCPHTLLQRDNYIYFMASGNGLVLSKDLSTGKLFLEASFPSFVRGMSFIGDTILCASSQLRWKDLKPPYVDLPVRSRCRIDKFGSLPHSAHLFTCKPRHLPLDIPPLEYTLHMDMTLHDHVIPLHHVTGMPGNYGEIYQVLYVPSTKLKYKTITLPHDIFKLLNISGLDT
jgi:hypothetical protein